MAPPGRASFYFYRPPDALTPNQGGQSWAELDVRIVYVFLRNIFRVSDRPQAGFRGGSESNLECVFTRKATN